MWWYLIQSEPSSHSLHLNIKHIYMQNYKIYITNLYPLSYHLETSITQQPTLPVAQNQIQMFISIKYKLWNSFRLIVITPNYCWKKKKKKKCCLVHVKVMNKNEGFRVVPWKQLLKTLQRDAVMCNSTRHCATLTESHLQDYCWSAWQCYQ